MLLLVLWVVLPVLAFAVLVSAVLIIQTRESIRNGGIDRARAMMTAVDTELSGSITTLQALAASRSLESDDLAAFHAEAVRVTPSQPSWTGITLALPSDFRQVVNTSRPFGAELPKLVEKQSAGRVVRTGQPAIGSVAVGSTLPAPLAAVRVPVLRNGAVAYVLTAVVRPESFEALIRQQNLPRGWAAAIIDRNGRFVARAPSRPAGSLASEAFRGAVQNETEGWFRGTTVDGVDTYQAFARSSFSGWSIGVALPASFAAAGERSTAWMLGLGALVAMGMALLGALFTGRRIAGPVAALALTARGAGMENVAHASSIGQVVEVNEVTDALKQARSAMIERQALVEREKAALVEADRAKDEFIAMLSHELRNPLSALTSASHLLKLAGHNGKAAEHARGVIERQTRHMTRLIEDLLDINRVAMGKVTLIREPLDLAELISEVVRTWRDAGRLGRHTVREKASRVWIDADRARIEQVFSNLLENALKFTPEGNGVTLSVYPHGTDAVLEVADQGAGIDSAMLGRIFGLFVQGEQELHRPAGGLGVGLALVKGLVELHGGSVAAASKGPGEGAVFTVRLPAAGPFGSAAPSPKRATSSRAEPRRILIVEDNEDARQMLRSMLVLAGDLVSDAADASAGLKLAATDRPDVMLIDIGLPDLTGYEVAERVRAMPRGERIVLIALTGYGQAEDKRRALEAGFDAHVTKPVLPEQLAELIEACSRKMNYSVS